MDKVYLVLLNTMSFKYVITTSHGAGRLMLKLFLLDFLKKVQDLRKEKVQK